MILCSNTAPILYIAKGAITAARATRYFHRAF